MQSQDIPREQWGELFDRISRQHQGEAVTVQLMGEHLGDYDEAPHFPLMGIVSDPKNSDGERIEVLAGDAADKHVEHFVANPRRVQLLCADDGRDEAVRIEGTDEPITLIRFEGPMH